MVVRFPTVRSRQDESRHLVLSVRRSPMSADHSFQERPTKHPIRFLSSLVILKTNVTTRSVPMLKTDTSHLLKRHTEANISAMSSPILPYPPPPQERGGGGYYAAQMCYPRASTSTSKMQAPYNGVFSTIRRRYFNAIQWRQTCESIHPKSNYFQNIDGFRQKNSQG